MGLAIGIIILMTGYFYIAPVQSQISRTTVQNLVALFSACPDNQINTNFCQQAARYIDYAWMAENTLGAKYWDNLSEPERTEFVAVFQKLIEQRYYARWHRNFSHASLHYQHETKDKGDILLKTILVLGKKQSQVIWRLHPKNGELAMIDLQVNKKDLLAHLKNRWQKQLAKRGFKGFFIWIKSHLHDEEN